WLPLYERGWQPPLRARPAYRREDRSEVAPAVAVDAGIPRTTECTAQGSAGLRMKGDRTRQAILNRAVDIASLEGLEGLTIGRLAEELQMSKSGLFAHFGSKEDLQLATVEAARDRFLDEAFRPALQA